MWIRDLDPLPLSVAFDAFIRDLIRPVGITHHVIGEPDSFFLSGLDLLAGEAFHTPNIGPLGES